MKKRTILEEIEGKVCYRKRDRSMTLCSILLFLKKKFDLKELTHREMTVVAYWDYSKNDLRKQHKSVVAFVYYLVMVSKTPSKGSANLI